MFIFAGNYRTTNTANIENYSLKMGSKIKKCKQKS